MIAARGAASRSRAVTLIELLVVVMILAILATVAVPNFLYAQTRSKLSRVRADLRTLASAVEAYTVDHNLPPLDWNVGRGDPQWPGMAPTTSGVLHPGRADSTVPGGVRPGLTTPVAYVNDCWLRDPFTAGASYEQIPFDEQKFSYNWFAPAQLRGAAPNPDYTFQEYAKHYGYWRLGSVGPDQDFFNGGIVVYTASRVYDPTNGIISGGNIWRSQKDSEVRGRPPLDDVLDP